VSPRAATVAKRVTPAAKRGAARTGRPTRAVRKEAGRVDILQASATLIAERGYHGMSMRDLAATTRMSLANLYNYFGSKEDVLFALQTRAFETLIAAAEEASSVPGAAEARLYAFILSHVRYVAGHRDVMRVLVEEAGELPTARRRAVRALKERYFRLGLELVRGVTAAGTGGRRAPSASALEPLTYSVFGMLNWVYAWYRPERHGAPPDIARVIHQIALGGLASRPAAPGALAATERRARRVALRSPIRLRDQA
jgi:AcrR family transcriptional regulator